MKEVLWYPSDRYLFDCLRGLKIYLLNRGVKREMDFGIDRIHGRGEPVIIEENRGILLHIPYCGYCEKIVVEAELTVKNKYLDLADKYWNARWQKEFWETWADIQDADRLRRYVEESGIKRVWVFGDGKIGRRIKEAFDGIRVPAEYIASKGKRYGQTRVYGIDELEVLGGDPDLLIITPMQDYLTIYHSLPARSREKAVTLHEFIANVISGRSMPL